MQSLFWETKKWQKQFVLCLKAAVEQMQQGVPNSTDLFMVITLKQFVTILLNTQDSGRMLHSLLKPKWKTKLLFFYYKHIFLYGAVVSLSLYYPKLCPCLIMVILFTLMPLSLSQNTVYQQRWYLTAALSCAWLFVCFCCCFFKRLSDANQH